MNPSDKHLFEQLKKAVTQAFLVDHYASDMIESWKGDEIVVFQEDLFQKVKARVSEKWFYTYIKKEPAKLPRIDMLNLLSTYAGYANWNDFKAKHQGKTIPKPLKPNKSKAIVVVIAASLVLVGAFAAFFYMQPRQHQFNFCMIDEDKNEAIHKILDIKVLQEGQSPVYLKTDSMGCFRYVTSEETIRFVVQSPYHKTDTIARHINTGGNPMVKLRTDDYALMLQYYSSGNTTDWKKRKVQLERLIDNNAQIYQLYGNNVGIELYSKEEFIDKLTTPTSSLKNIRILDRAYENGKIVKLKFMVQ
ncbi:MAG: hypothetical protein AAFP76_09270 [Bacteroidota bacterium]